MRAATILVLLLLVAPAHGSRAQADESPIEVTIHLDASNLTWTTWWYKVKFRQALAYWEENDRTRFGRDVRFVETDAADASVRFWFRDETRVGATCGHAEEALGCARRVGPTAWDVEVKTRREDGRHYSYRLVGDVSKHEIGHVLGLPHADDPRDIMFHALDTTGYADASPPDHPLRVAGIVLAFVVGVAVMILLLLRVAWSRPSEESEEEAGPAPRKPD